MIFLSWGDEGSVGFKEIIKEEEGKIVIMSILKGYWLIDGLC